MRVNTSGRVSVSVLQKRYNKQARFLGHGSFGFVILIENTVLKIQEFDGAAEQEIDMLSKLNPISPVFTKAYQCFVCNNLPKDWVRLGQRECPGLMEYFLNKRTEPYLVIEMQYNPFMFLNAHYVPMKRFLYSLIEAIMLARKTLGIFALNDLHKGNLMTDGRGNPKLIDFGFASDAEDVLEDEMQFRSYTDSGGHQAGKNDFVRLEIILKEKGWDWSGLDLSKAKIAKADDWKVLEEVLNQEFFKT
jgi:serine/threonine protein kinase